MSFIEIWLDIKRHLFKKIKNKEKYPLYPLLLRTNKLPYVRNIDNNSICGTFYLFIHRPPLLLVSGLRPNSCRYSSIFLYFLPQTLFPWDFHQCVLFQHWKGKRYNSLNLYRPTTFKIIVHIRKKKMCPIQSHFL